jgi:circadian clock protein KaiC
VKSLSKALELKPDHGPAITLRTDIERRKSTDAVRAVTDEIDRELEELEQRARARAAEPDALDIDVSTPKESAAPVVVPEPAAEARPSRPVPAEAPARAKNRMYTYIEGLDEALNGGIPEGHVVIVAGPPGTLKSSLCLSIATYNAAKERRPSLYITLEESRESFQIQGRSLGLPLEETDGLLMFLDARDLRASVPRAGEDWVDAFAAGIEALRSERPFDLLVLDALEGLEAVARFPDRRRAIFRLFEHLRALAVTTLVVAERPDILFQGNVLYGRWSEDFLADGILHLRQHIVSENDVVRRIRIVKMRGTRHETGYMALLVDDGRLRATRAMAP